MTIAKLFARIGIDDKGSAPLSRFLNTASNTTTAVVTLTREAVNLANSIRTMAQESLDAAAALNKFEAETGASAQELQRWQYVAEQANVSTEAITNSIKQLASQREKIKLGQGDISGYQLLGIDPMQDPFKIMEELREKTTGLSQAMKRNILSQMGVSGDLIRVLDLTNAEFETMASQAFIISPGAIESMNRTRGIMNTVGNAIKYIKTQIVVGLAPTIEKTSKQLTEWVKSNETGIIETFQKGVEWIQKFFTSVSRVLGIIDGVVDRTIGWKNAMYGLLAVFGLLNAQLLLSPIGLVTAGIIALILVMEDLYVYSKGGKSAFGLLLEKFPALEKLISGTVEKFQKIKDFFKALFSPTEYTFEELETRFGTFGATVITKFQEIRTKANETLGDLGGLFKALFAGDNISIMAYEEKLGLLGSVVVNTYENIKGTFGLIKALIEGDDVGIAKFKTGMEGLADAIIILFETVRVAWDLTKEAFNTMVEEMNPINWEWLKTTGQYLKGELSTGDFLLQLGKNIIVDPIKDTVQGGKNIFERVREGVNNIRVELNINTVTEDVAEEVNRNMNNILQTYTYQGVNNE